MERPFYEADEDRTNLVPSLQQDAPWVQFPDACAGVETTLPPCCSLFPGIGYFETTTPPTRSAFATGLGHDLDGTVHRQTSTPHGTSLYRSPNANGPTAIYDAGQGYYAMDSSIMSSGYPDVHNTPSNQGQGPHLTSNPYSAGTTDEFTPLHGYDATYTAYGTTSTAYDATNAVYDDASAAYGAINAAYGAGTNTGDLTRGIWPSTDPVSTLMGYDHGVADVNTTVYSFVPNLTLAPSTTTPVSPEQKPAVACTDGSRPQCSTCNTTFKRASDLARHQKKHQARRAFKCLVPECNFKGSYRKDKLDAHVKSCHPRGAA